MNSDLRWNLSTGASHDIDWQAIEDVFSIGAFSQESRGAIAAATRGAPAIPLTEDEKQAARRAFSIVKEEFTRGMSWVRTAIRWSIAGVIVAVALAVVGGVLIQVSPWASLISIASVASLFALLPRAFGLARDEAMLELIPARYALALELCNTRGDLQKLTARFLDETSSIRKSPSKKSKGSA